MSISVAHVRAFRVFFITAFTMVIIAQSQPLKMGITPKIVAVCEANARWGGAGLGREHHLSKDIQQALESSINTSYKKYLNKNKKLNWE